MSRSAMVDSLPTPFNAEEKLTFNERFVAHASVKKRWATKPERYKGAGIAWDHAKMRSTASLKRAGGTEAGEWLFF